MYDFTDKKNGLIHKNNYMLARTLSMFDYENLPENRKRNHQGCEV